MTHATGIHVAPGSSQLYLKLGSGDVQAPGAFWSGDFLRLLSKPLCHFPSNPPRQGAPSGVLLSAGEGGGDVRGNGQPPETWNPGTQDPLWLLAVPKAGT